MDTFLYSINVILSYPKIIVMYVNNHLRIYTFIYCGTFGSLYTPHEQVWLWIWHIPSITTHESFFLYRQKYMIHGGTQRFSDHVSLLDVSPVRPRLKSALKRKGCMPIDTIAHDLMILFLLIWQLSVYPHRCFTGWER